MNLHPHTQPTLMERVIADLENEKLFCLRRMSLKGPKDPELARGYRRIIDNIDAALTEIREARL